MARVGRRETRGERDESAGDEIERLFQLPLGEFTRARNALVAKLKKDGTSEKAKQVKGLTKPSISAWVANQLYWRDRKAFDRLLAAGEQFRTAQAAQLAGNSADIRAPLVARREALTELAKQASAMLRDAGYASSREEKRRATLETQFEKAKADAESARQEAGRAASRAEAAAQAVDDADRAVQRAREALRDL